MIYISVQYSQSLVVSHVEHKLVIVFSIRRVDSMPIPPENVISKPVLAARPSSLTGEYLFTYLVTEDGPKPV